MPREANLNDSRFTAGTVWECLQQVSQRAARCLSQGLWVLLPQIYFENLDGQKSWKQVSKLLTAPKTGVTMERLPFGGVFPVAHFYSPLLC